jgi:DNA-binding response OmpR family regulator
MNKTSEGKWSGHMRLLLVEDNHHLSASLALNLTHEGYEVDVAYDGQEGQDLAELNLYDLIILDILLPRKDGLEVCRALRQRRIHTPILLLTARDTVEDRVQGLDEGADDYLVKPFAVSELLARLRALSRRHTSATNSPLSCGDLWLDPATHSVVREGCAIDLTPREFALLEYLLSYPNQVITREMIEQRIWDDEVAIGSNVVDVYIRRLRRKIDDPFATPLLVTIRGIGYRMCAPPRERA